MKSTTNKCFPGAFDNSLVSTNNFKILAGLDLTIGAQSLMSNSNTNYFLTKYKKGQN